MKKKSLKSLSLRKSSISKLNGGSNVPSPTLQTINIRDCALTNNLADCTTTVWHSELYSACCPPSQRINCESFNFPCEESVNIICKL